MTWDFNLEDLPPVCGQSVTVLTLGLGSLFGCEDSMRRNSPGANANNAGVKSNDQYEW